MQLCTTDKHSLFKNVLDSRKNDSPYPLQWQFQLLLQRLLEGGVTLASEFDFGVGRQSIAEKAHYHEVMYTHYVTLLVSREALIVQEL